MTAGWRELKLRDILYGVVVPFIVGLIIIAFPLSRPLLRQLNPGLINILVFGIAEVILTAAVPMLLGLVWNQWAGGASGFLLGSIYALWYAIYGISTPGWTSDISLLGYCVSAMLIGYMAGALNKRDSAFSRMLFSGLVAGIAGSLFLWIPLQLSAFHAVYGAFGFFVTIAPRIAAGVLMPILAKLFYWFGMTPRQTKLAS